MAYHWTAGLMGVTTAVAVVLATMVGRRRGPGVRPFVGLMMAVAIWTLGYGFELSSVNMGRMLFWLRVEYLGIPFVGVLWYLMIREMTAALPTHWRWPLALLAPPCVVVILAATNPWHHWMHVAPRISERGPMPMIEFGRGPAYWFNWSYSWLLIAAGYGRLIRGLTSLGRGFRRPAAYLAASMALPAALNLAYVGGWRPWGVFDLTPVGIVLGGVLVAAGLFRAALFDLTPFARSYVFDAMRDAVLVADGEGRLIDFNAEAQRLFGPLRPGKLVTSSPGIWPALAQAMVSQSTGTFLSPSDGADGAVHEASVSLFSCPQRGRGVVGLVRDVSLHLKTQEALRRREFLLASLSESARLLLEAKGPLDFQGLVSILGPAAGVDRAYVFLNEFREDGVLCTTQVAEWCAPGIRSELHNPLLRRVAFEEIGAARWRQVLAAGGEICSRVADCPPGERELLSSQGIKAVLAYPLITDEGFVGFVGFDNCHDDRLWDAPEREFLRHAALNLSLALRRHRTEEVLRHSQKFETVGRLAGGVAHDFNNLLQVINGYADLALETLPPDDPRANDFREIRKAGQRAAALTQKLLAFSRRQVLRSEPIDLHVFLEDLRGTLNRLLGERVTLCYRPEATDRVVEISPSALEQIVLNLVVNAGEAMPGGGTITLATRTVQVDDEHARVRNVPPGRYAAVSVQDTGVGMSPEVMAHLFEPFFTTKPQGKGVGLGLATVYGLVRQGGGQVYAQSEPGQGSVFTVLLPLSQRPAGDGTSTKEQMAIGIGRERVMIVEDDDAVRRLLAQALRNGGYQVLTAATAEEALDAFRKRGENVDLLITDIVLPGMDGAALAVNVRKDWPELKVLFISGYAKTNDDVQGERLPDHAVLLPKPVSATELLATVRALLDDRRGAMPVQG